MDKTKPVTCFCTKPWNCGYNEDGWCDFHNTSCNQICIAYGGGVPMTNRDASAALGCALQWNGSGQYDHDAAKEAVRVAQIALDLADRMVRCHECVKRDKIGFCVFINKFVPDGGFCYGGKREMDANGDET